MERRILALDPGTRYLGFALFDGPRLVYHGVLTLSPHHHPARRIDEATHRIGRMIRDWRPDTLALEGALWRGRGRSAVMTTLVQELTRLGERRGLRTRAHAPSTVKKRVAGNGHASKEEVWQVVVSRYPDLRPYLVTDSKWKARFHGNMLDAVAVGLVEIDSRLMGHSRRV